MMMVMVMVNWCAMQIQKGIRKEEEKQESGVCRTAGMS
jgi:hypothetical protein